MRAWAQLTWDAKEACREVFPSGKVPVKTIAIQGVRFDGFRDPESVFCVDWDALDVWQREVLEGRFGELGFLKASFGKGAGVCFLFCRPQVCLLGVGGCFLG